MMQRGEMFQPKIWWDRMENVTQRPHFLFDFESGPDEYVQVQLLAPLRHVLPAHTQ